MRRCADPTTAHPSRARSSFSFCGAVSGVPPQEEAAMAHLRVPRTARGGVKKIERIKRRLRALPTCVNRPEMLRCR
jgi:hypothetical protein